MSCLSKNDFILSIHLITGESRTVFKHQFLNIFKICSLIAVNYVLMHAMQKKISFNVTNAQTLQMRIKFT